MGESRHSPTNCPLAYRHLEEILTVVEGGREGESAGSAEILDSLALACQQVVERELLSDTRSVREKSERRKVERRES